MSPGFASTIQRRYFNERGWRIVEALQSVADELDAQPSEIALAWLLAQPAVVAPIVGANTPEQLAAGLGAVDLELSEEQLARLDEASAWQ